MRAIGIVGEFNPFHQGHKYLIDNSVKELQADVVVAAMSGSFTQRGEPSYADKWTRAGICVENGIDLVCEIPAVYACNSAEHFARGGVSVLEGFGQIDHICFGSESGDVKLLTKIAISLKDNRDFINRETSLLLKQGYSYPRARSMVLSAMDEDLDLQLLEGSNNILALEYICALSGMKPFTVKRTGESYSVSATLERERMISEDPETFRKRENRYFDILRAEIISKSPEELEAVYQSGEGLGNKAKKEIRRACSTEDLVERLKSKAYTRTRITRFLTQILLGIDEGIVSGAEPFARVLAFNDKGAAFMKKCMKEETLSIPLISNINKIRGLSEAAGRTLALDIRATDMYNIITGQDMYLWSDHVKKPFTGE